MKTLFLYAPDRCLPTIPYSSLPALQACLRKVGQSTEIMDLNVELFDWLVKGDRIASYHGWVRNRFAELESKDALSESDIAMYRFLAPLVAPSQESFARAEGAALVLRDKEKFFVPALFNQAFDDLTAVIRFLYAATPILNPENQKHYVEQLLYYSQNAADPMIQCYEDHLADLILSRKPDLLAFTIPFHTQLLEILKILRVVKRKAPHVKCVIGGPTVHDYQHTLFADGRLFDWIDYGMMGEGENAIVQLLEALEGKRELDQVANLYYRAADGSVHAPAVDDLPNMNDAPTLDFDGVPFDRYLLPERLANFQTSRGCYYGKCTFCGDGFRRNFRARHADLVYDDIKSIAENFDVKYFLFWDSLAPPRTLISVSKRIKEQGPDVYWFAETKFEYTYANKQTVETLYNGGGRVFQFGFESAVDRVLGLIDKGNELEKVDACLTALSEAGIGVCTSWFIGFPTEREHEALITYDYVSQRRDKIVMSIYSGIFNLGRDTIVYQNPDRFGVKIVEPESGEIFVDDGLPPWDKKTWNERLEQRGDLPLLCQGGYLLYQTEHPELLREIVAKGRTGPLGREMPELPRELPIRPERNRLVRYKWNPYQPASAPVPGGFPVVYVAFHGMYHAIDADQVAIFEACDGKKSVQQLASLVKGDEKAALAKVEWMIDRGLIVVPKLLPEYRGLAKSRAVPALR